MVFELLHESIRKVLRDKDIHEPTGPQKEAIPYILEGRNVLLVAPTGIGKTEAAILPVLHKIITSPGKGIRCIYVTPLRALNRDMLRRFEEFGEAFGLDVAVRHGDTPQSERQRQSKHAPDILITTPETLQIMFTGKNLRSHLSHVQYFIVDEIHELTDDERGAQLAIAMERLVNIAGEFQRIGLSATVGSVPEVANFLAGADRRVSIVKAQVAKEMSLAVLCPQVTDKDKDLAGTLQSDPQLIACMRRSREMIEKHRSTLLFVNTRDTAEALAARYHVWDEEFKVGVHHGSLSKETRIEMEEDFKAERLRGLICTSSLELGIDIGSADFAIQYNSPRQVARLIQRMGRSGHHVGGTAEGAIIASNPDEVAESLVIVRKALNDELEPIRVRDCPMTVLANQLVAMAMVGRVDVEEAFLTVRRSYPFRKLSKEQFMDVLRLVAQIGLLFIEGGKFLKSARGRQYFYDNISMIPDERTYLVRDLSSRSIVGTLDESFVVAFAEPYACFITRGRTWRIVEIKEDELLVEQVKEIGSIPSWVGEDIPVPYSVAQEVGVLRRSENYDDYLGDKDAQRELHKYLREQGETASMPTDNLVTLEMGNKLAILNACFGTKVNETLAKMLSTLLSARLGESVGVTTDPYRIILELPRDVASNTIIDTMRSVRSSTVESLIRMVIRNSSHLRWRFVYVAKKFGAVDKEADYRNVNFGRLVEAYDGTPMFDEAVNKVMWEDLDMDGTMDVIRRIEQGEMELKIGTMSPIGRAGLKHSKELITPQRADHSILMALKKRLEGELMYLSCLNCGHQFRLRPVEAPKRVVCQNCGGTMVAALSSYEKEKIRLLKKKEPTEDEQKEIKRLYKNASLVSTQGKKAMVALSGRGVGPDTASRILSSFQEDEDEFLRDILTAEINYAKTKRFWD